MGSDVREIPSTSTKNDKPQHSDSCMGPSLMVMVPGLFQTLDTLEKAVLPLLEVHPELTVLLVAPPGLPNTHWPANISLDGEVRHSTVLFSLPGCIWLFWYRWCWRHVIFFIVDLGVTEPGTSPQVGRNKCRCHSRMQRNVVALSCRVHRLGDQAGCAWLGS